jgi:hypothetical protein
MQAIPSFWMFIIHVDFFVIDIYKYTSQIYDVNLIMPRVKSAFEG